MDKRRITTYQDAVDVLRCPHSLSNRKERDYGIIRNVDAELADGIKSFFQQWPMYNDGSLHQASREGLMRVFNRHAFVQRAEVVARLREILAVESITALEIERCVLSWHSLFFGIEAGDDEELMRQTEPLMSFVLFKHYELVEEARFALRQIETFFHRRGYSDSGLVHALVAAGIGHGAIMNLMVDSYIPMIAGAKSVLFHAFRGTCEEVAGPRERKQVILGGLSRLPPFRYINRLVPNEAGQLELTEIDVLACNRNLAEAGRPESGHRTALTFGIGRHMCLGLRPALEFYDDLLSVAHGLMLSHDVHLSGSPSDTSPVCSVDELAILVNERADRVDQRYD